MESYQLSNFHLDVLREIGNIAAGNAATALSILTNKKIDMNVPEVSLIPFEEVMELIGGPEELIVAIYIRMIGDTPGTVYFTLSIDEAEQLARQMTGNESFQILDENLGSDNMEFSALMEVGNILAGSYLSALSDFTKLNIQPSIPSLNIDMAGAILSVGLIEISPVTDSAIVIDTRINDDADHKINGQFFLLPDLDAVPIILRALGVSDV